MQAVLPVDEAFAPIKAMERHLIMSVLDPDLIATLISWMVAAPATAPCPAATLLRPHE